MFNLTKEEKIVVLIFIGVVWIGSIFCHAFKKYPHLAKLINLMESESIYYKIDVNKASEEELINLPFIGPATARRIIDFRNTQGPITSLQQIQSLDGINSKNFKEFSKFLKI